MPGWFAIFLAVSSVIGAGSGSFSRSISGANSGLVRHLLKTDETVQIAENFLEVQYIDLAVSLEGAFAENR